MRMSGAVRSRLARRLRGKRLSSTGFGVPYVLLGVLAVMTLPRKEHSAVLVLGLSLCVLAAAWMLFLETLNRSWLDRAHSAVFVTGLMVITAVLVILDSWFGFFAAVCFGYARARLRWPWQMAGATGAALLAAMSQTEDAQVSLPFHLMMFAFALTLDVLLCGSLMWLLWEREEQIAQHQRALVELNAANRRLEATITENDALHQRLIAQAREAGILDERRRMAREIHDTLAQGLTGIVTQLQATERAADDPVRWRRHLAAATGLAREGLTEARRSVHALRPEPLETARLSEALASVAERWSTLNGIPVQVTTTGTVRPVQPEAEFALLRAAQEALANVARHARATRVGLTVSYLENEVALDVRDDGVGFDATRLDPGQPGGDGFGLIAMRQRIEGVAGTLQVESEPGGGTAISACVPTVPALAES
jgi:signal transduction histidine kinase